MTRIEVLQLKRAAIILAAMGKGMKNPDAREDILRMSAVLIKAIRHIERGLPPGPLPEVGKTQTEAHKILEEGRSDVSEK